jgi:hypothetical protein
MTQEREEQRKRDQRDRDERRLRTLERDEEGPGAIPKEGQQAPNLPPPRQGHQQGQQR